MHSKYYKANHIIHSWHGTKLQAESETLTFHCPVISMLLNTSSVFIRMEHLPTVAVSQNQT